VFTNTGRLPCRASWSVINQRVQVYDIAVRHNDPAMATRSRSVANRWVPVGVAIGVVALAAFVLYPGWYSFDSAALLLQARTGEYTGLQPPLMALTWAQLLALGAPPGALLVLHLMLACAGLCLLARSAAAPMAPLLPLLLLWPPFLVLFGHLWTDVALAAALVLAAGLLALARTQPQAAWIALLPLAYAVGVRHNAVAAALPLLMLVFVRLPRWRGTAAAAALMAAVAGFVLYASAAGLTRLVVAEPRPAWTPTAIWDLSAVSVASGQILLPAAMHGPGLSVDELRRLTNPDASLNLLVGSSSGINSGIVAPLPAPLLRELRQRWMGLPLSNPQAWLRHRVAVAWSLFGPQRRDKLDDLMIVPRIVTLADNPPIVANATVANAKLAGAVLRWRDQPWCTPILYLLLALPALGWALRRDFDGDRALVASLVASAWLYAVPLVFIVPSAEWRYALWPMLACAVALLLALRRQRA